MKDIIYNIKYFVNFYKNYHFLGFKTIFVTSYKNWCREEPAS